jgi:hypothetical protein
MYHLHFQYFRLFVRDYIIFNCSQLNLICSYSMFQLSFYHIYFFLRFLCLFLSLSVFSLINYKMKMSYLCFEIRLLVFLNVNFIFVDLGLQFFQVCNLQSSDPISLYYFYSFIIFISSNLNVSLYF